MPKANTHLSTERYLDDELIGEELLGCMTERAAQFLERDGESIRVAFFWEDDEQQICGYEISETAEGGKHLRIDGGHEKLLGAIVAFLDWCEYDEDDEDDGEDEDED